VCVVDGRNEDGREPSVTMKCKLCKVRVCLVRGKLLVKEMRSFLRDGKDHCNVETEVETPQGKGYVVVSARGWVEGDRVWDDFVAGLENLNGVDEVLSFVECAMKTVMVQRTPGGGDGGFMAGASGSDVSSEGWNSVNGNQVIEEGRSLGKREFFHTSWHCEGRMNM
jgi:hypothetical protein